MYYEEIFLKSHCFNLLPSPDATTNDISGNTNLKFKPFNLFQYQKGGNVHAFLKRFENSICRATNQEKSSTVINYLDAVCIKLVMAHLLNLQQTYQEGHAL